MTRQQAIDFLKNNPAKYGRMLGFNKLGVLHNQWIKEMVCGSEDHTLQASRGTYKTTCVSIALALIVVLLPNKRTLFLRKTDSDVKEVIKQVQNILADPHTQYFVQIIYNVNLKMTVQSVTEVSTNLTTDKRGTSQLLGIGCGSSITGKHFDRIFTDDIVNVQDRISKAARDHTKTVYQELQNIKNRGGRIFNTGTPWHKDDCFLIMPEAEKYNCYNDEIKKIISDDELQQLKSSMMPSLFAANYELKHIAGDDVLFTEVPVNAPTQNIMNGIGHVDSAFYGEDFTAFTIMTYHDDHYYIFGKLWRKHIETCYVEIAEYFSKFLVQKIHNERNADKGMVARDMKNLGLRVVPYDEHMNKHIKICTYLKAIWKDVIFVEGTDPEYIEQIEDYTEDAEHDDAPDSAACLARIFYPKVTRHEGRKDIVAELLQRSGMGDE